MQSVPVLSIVLLLAFFLTACGGGSSNPNDTDTLKIDSVYTDIWHQHPSFFEKWNSSPTIGIRFSVSVQVTLAGGPDNLSELFIRDKVTGSYWSLLGGPNNVTQEQCYISDLDIYECFFYSPLSLNRISLKNWEVVAENRQGVVASKDIEFLLPGGDKIDDEQFVFSSIYSGSKRNGVVALEAMTSAENEIEFRADPISQSFHIEFKTLDRRATHYGFYFYDGTRNINNIGEIRSNAPSIQSMPIIMGQKTIVDIPWSEIRLYANASISDINGIHVILYDDPIPWLNDGVWFNYISLSEFITLAP